MSLPTTQRAVQLVGPDQLSLNEHKPVFTPGPHQILCRVEVCGLCFSDLKLLKQFSAHARKAPVQSGLDPATLREMPQYVPGDKPTVPGHETVVRIVQVGPGVTRFRVGQRYLVQTDYRHLPTANSASAFGYNFEGALQEYVLVDERVITPPDGESLFLPVPEDLSASALALCEPWACVEDAYVDRQRRQLKDDGQTLLVGETLPDAARIAHLPGKPAAITPVTPDQLAHLPDAAYDDVIYFGAEPATVEKLWPKVAVAGIVNLVQEGKKFGRPVVTAIGRVHYGLIRIIGTTGHDPATSFAYVPASAEIRPRNKINIIGAAGPMGTMHVIRNLCQGVPGITIYAGDLSDERLATLQKLAAPIAAQNQLQLIPYNPKNNPPHEPFDYIVLMAPVAALVVQAVHEAAPGAIINIFAGIPAHVTAELDLDQYIQKQAYFIGTSGSTLDDMKTVLQKVVRRQLDTNLSVAAVAGLEGAIDGIRAVEKNTIPGKILVYPAARGLQLTPIRDLIGDRPWDLAAEKQLLQS